MAPSWRPPSASPSQPRTRSTRWASKEWMWAMRPSTPSRWMTSPPSALSLWKVSSLNRDDSVQSHWICQRCLSWVTEKQVVEQKDGMRHGNLAGSHARSARLVHLFCQFVCVLLVLGLLRSERKKSSLTVFVCLGGPCVVDRMLKLWPWKDENSTKMGMKTEAMGWGEGWGGGVGGGKQQAESEKREKGQDKENKTDKEKREAKKKKEEIHLTHVYFGFLLSVEEEVEFVRKLEDIDVVEIPGTALFECEVSRLNTVAEWFCNNKPITASDKYELESKGVIHRLTIKDVDGKDEGDYKVVVKGKTSEAGLFVEGEQLIFFLEIVGCVVLWENWCGIDQNFVFYKLKTLGSLVTCYTCWEVISVMSFFSPARKGFCHSNVVLVYSKSWCNCCFRSHDIKQHKACLSRWLCVQSCGIGWM